MEPIIIDMAWVFNGLTIFALIATVYAIWYTRFRMRLHEKGLVDWRHDGLQAKPGEPRTLFDCWRLEKEYDAKQRKKQKED